MFALYSLKVYKIMIENKRKKTNSLMVMKKTWPVLLKAFVNHEQESKQWQHIILCQNRKTSCTYSYNF